MKKYDAHLYCLEFGSDIEKARQLVKDLNIEHYVTFYNFVASKPLLKELFHNHDAVIGNLSFPNIGTTELEAMACNVPVIAHNDIVGELEKNMPIMEAKTEEEIYKKMIDVCENKNIPKGLRTFVESNYGPNRYVEIFSQMIDELSDKN